MLLLLCLQGCRPWLSWLPCADCAFGLLAFLLPRHPALCQVRPQLARLLCLEALLLLQPHRRLCLRQQSCCVRHASAGGASWACRRHLHRFQHRCPRWRRLPVQKCSRLSRYLALHHRLPVPVRQTLRLRWRLRHHALRAACGLHGVPGDGGVSCVVRRFRPVEPRCFCRCQPRCSCRCRCRCRLSSSAMSTSSDSVGSSLASIP